MTDAAKPTGRSRRPRPAAPTTPDPVEIAMAAEASGKAPTGEASALLRRHSALIDKQLVLASNEIFRNRIRSVRDAALAAMVVALAIGLVVSIAQAVTQIQEQTIQFVPKLVAMLVLTILLLPWTLTRLMEYSTTLIKDIPSRL